MKRVWAQVLASGVLVTGCAGQPRPHPPVILSDDVRTFTSPSGQTYAVRSEAVPDEDETLPPLPFDADPEEYRGKARKAAKLTLSDAGLETYSSLRRLRFALRVLSPFPGPLRLSFSG